MIVGFNFKKIAVERKKKLIKGMKVRYDMDLKEVYEESSRLSSGGSTVLGFAFEFSVDYNPDIVSLKILGTVNYMLPQDEAKKVLDLWKTTKKLPKDVSIPVINNILDRCNIKALELEQDMALPSHIPMPSLATPTTSKKDTAEAEKYIG